MKEIKELLRCLIQESYPSKHAMHVTPIDYRSPGGRGTGVAAASKLTGDTPQRAQLGRPPKPTPMHGQTGGTSVAGVDVMASLMMQNSGDSYYVPDEYDEAPVPNLGDEDIRTRERIRKLVNIMFLNPEDADIDSMADDHGAQSPAGHLTHRARYLDNALDSPNSLDENPDDDADEASGAAAVGGVTVPLGAGPNYPNKSKRGKQPPSWRYYMKAVGGSPI